MTTQNNTENEEKANMPKSTLLVKVEKQDGAWLYTRYAGKTRVNAVKSVDPLNQKHIEMFRLDPALLYKEFEVDPTAA